MLNVAPDEERDPAAVPASETVHFGGLGDEQDLDRRPLAGVRPRLQQADHNGGEAAGHAADQSAGPAFTHGVSCGTR